MVVDCHQIWDPRQKAAVDFIGTDFPVTAVALSEAGNELYSGGIDNDIRVWDLRKQAVAYSLLGHTDTITSLSVSPDSQSLLSNSHDSTVRSWDIRPFAPTNRHVRTFDGAPTGLEKNLYKASWSTDGKTIAAGSGDRTVVCWDAATGRLLYKLPGHKGAVNDVRFSPSEPISKPPYFGAISRSLHPSTEIESIILANINLFVSWKKLLSDFVARACDICSVLRQNALC